MKQDISGSRREEDWGGYNIRRGQKKKQQHTADAHQVIKRGRKLDRKYEGNKREIREEMPKVKKKIKPDSVVPRKSCSKCGPPLINRLHL